MAWIITDAGFFSIVEKTEDRNRGTLTVRARVREDLVNLRERYLPSLGDITFSQHTDYPYRAIAERCDVAEAMANAVAGIRYDNFKNAAAKAQGKNRARVYEMVWRDLTRLEMIQS